MLRFLVALALVLSTVQCASACTPVSARDSQPPCHHHKQAPARCGQELVPATIVQPATHHVSFAAEAVETQFAPGAIVSFRIPVADHQSPPGSPPKSLQI